MNRQETRYEESEFLQYSRYVQTTVSRMEVAVSEMLKRNGLVKNDGNATIFDYTDAKKKGYSFNKVEIDTIKDAYVSEKMIEMELFHNGFKIDSESFLIKVEVKY